MDPKFSNKLQGYRVKTPDWRSLLRQNDRNTYIVIIIFLLSYVAIGFLMDLYFYNNNPYTNTASTSRFYQQPIDSQEIFPSISMDDLKREATNLATFRIPPIVSFIMLIIALFSLGLTLLFHRKMVMLGTDYTVVTADSTNREELQLYNVVEELKIASGLRYMPKVCIIEADYMNAFASGISEKSALLAITRGLLEKLDRSELQAVMAHELSHIRHNDIRLTIMVALLSNLMLIAIDILFRGVLYSRDRDNRLAIIIIVIRFLLPIITILLMLYLSRTREYMADSGSVELTRDNEPLARALLKIHQDHTGHFSQYNRDYKKTPHEELRNASYFYDPSYAGIEPIQSLNTLFSTHPPLKDRLRALGIEEIIKNTKQ